MPSKRKIEEVEVSEPGPPRPNASHNFDSQAEIREDRRPSSKASKQRRIGNAINSTSTAMSDILDAVQVNASIARLSYATTHLCSRLQAQVLEIVAGTRPLNELSHIRKLVSTHLAILGTEVSDSLGTKNVEDDVPRSETLDADTCQHDLSDDEHLESESDETDDSSSLDGMEDSGAEGIKHKPKIVDLDEVNAPLRPNIQAPKAKDRVRSALLIERLKDFMPKMEKSMTEMEQKRRAGTFNALSAEDVEGEETVIEMNLGLGVLEEKPPSSRAIDGITLTRDEQDEGEALGWEDMLANVVGTQSMSTDVNIEVLEDVAKA